MFAGLGPPCVNMSATAPTAATIPPHIAFDAYQDFESISVDGINSVLLYAAASANCWKKSTYTRPPSIAITVPATGAAAVLVEVLTV